VATHSYRCGKAFRGAPENFAAFRVADKSRTAVEILAHIADLVDWALSQAQGKETWHASEPLPWDEETALVRRTRITGCLPGLCRAAGLAR